MLSHSGQGIAWRMVGGYVLSIVYVNRVYSGMFGMRGLIVAAL